MTKYKMVWYKMVCAYCGSEDVVADSYSQWNVDTQDWETVSTFDKGAYCNGKCDGETRIKEIEIADADPCESTQHQSQPDEGSGASCHHG